MRHRLLLITIESIFVGVSVYIVVSVDGGQSEYSITRNVFKPCPLLPLLLNVFFDYHQNNGEKVGLSPILSVIQTVIIGTVLNFNGSNNGHRLK